MLPRAIVLLALIACAKPASSPQIDPAEYGIVEGPIVENENKALYVGRNLIEPKHLVAKLGYDWREKTKDRRVRIEGTITEQNVVGPNGQLVAPGELEEVLAAMSAGVAYANVHSTLVPGGEIRGQIR